MSAQAVARLEKLAGDDLVVAPLALLQVEALRAATDPSWEGYVPDLEPRRLDSSQPILNCLTASVDPDRVQKLLERLAAVAERQGTADAGDLRRAISGKTIEPLMLLEASIAQDNDGLQRQADSADVPAELLAPLAHLASLPLLLACGREASSLVTELNWEPGYCPVCAAWPALAELRGLERRCWLRCGRCGGEWPTDQQRCVFCDSRDHRQQGYLAAAEARDSRRVATCEECKGYLKQLATLGPIPPAEIALQDLTTVELDLAALERGFARPEQPGFRLRLTLEPARRRSRWRL